MFFAAPESPAPTTTTFQLIVELVKAFAWPFIAMLAIVVFYKPVQAILESLKRRMDAGASIEIYSVKVGEAPVNLPTPAVGDVITSDYMALVHTSWRYPKKDAEFGMRMWAFHVVVQAKDEVLDRIEYAKYLLDPSYPNPVQVVTDRTTRFKLKELANGESTVRCQIKIKGQSELIMLERYINLTDTGPRI